MRVYIPLVLLAAFLVFAVVFSALSVRAELVCFRNGYPESSTYIKSYCIKTVDGTTVIVPLSEVVK